MEGARVSKTSAMTLVISSTQPRRHIYEEASSNSFNFIIQTASEIAAGKTKLGQESFQTGKKKKWKKGKEKILRSVRGFCAKELQKS